MRILGQKAKTKLFDLFWKNEVSRIIGRLTLFTFHFCPSFPPLLRASICLSRLRPPSSVPLGWLVTSSRLAVVNCQLAKPTLHAFVFLILIFLFFLSFVNLTWRANGNSAQQLSPTLTSLGTHYSSLNLIYQANLK